MKSLVKLSRDELLRILYDQYTVGISFTEVRRELAAEQHRRRANGDYMYVTRRTVLGRMHQIKKYLFEASFGNLSKKEIEKLIGNPNLMKRSMSISEKVF